MKRRELIIRISSSSTTDLHCGRCVDEENGEEEGLYNDAEGIDGGDEVGARLDNAVVSPERGAQPSAYVRKALELLRRFLLQNPPECSAAIV